MNASAGTAPLAARPAVPPATCQQGHPLVWLVGPGMEHAGGEGLAGCACAFRRLDGREFKGSQPILWRWLPTVANGGGLRPQFVSQNRQAFALALRLLALLDETGHLTEEVQAVSRKALHVAGLAARVRELAPEAVGQRKPPRRTGKTTSPA